MDPFIFVVYFILCAQFALSKEIPKIENVKQVAAIPLGENLAWTYHHNNVPYCIRTVQASDDCSVRPLFSFIRQPGNDIIVKIQTPSNYLSINTNGQLSHSSSQPVFWLIPVSNDTNNVKFFVYAENSGLLVTPMSRPPFSFYIQSRYPQELPAEFSLSFYLLNVSEAYGGNRDNVLPTLKLIQDLPVDKVVAYKELVQLMGEFGHFKGEEVFEVAASIVKEMGSAIEAFKLLPLVVQTISSGEPTRLFYRETNNGDLPMKEGLAWVPQNQVNYIMPYKFISSDDRKSWSISYGANDMLDLNRFNHLVSMKFTAERNNFKLTLHENLNSVIIYAQVTPNFYRLRKIKVSGLNYYFIADGVLGHDTAFWAVPYELDLVEMYGKIRNNIAGTAEFIQNSTLMLEERTGYYRQLIILTQEAGHWKGQEIFKLAQTILDDSAIESSEPILRMLPPVVRFIVQNGGLKLSFNSSFPLKYSWASDLHENILPFAISYSKIHQRYALTYSDQIQWTCIYGDLIDIKSYEKQYGFDFSLDADFVKVKILWWVEKFYPLVTANLKSDFYFKCQNGESQSTFLIQKFD